MKTYKALSIIAIIISLIALAFVRMRITPFDVTNDVYIGIVASFIGISVTLLIGFQIINTLEIRREILEQKTISINVQKLYDELKQTTERHEIEMEDGFEIINTLIQHQKNGENHSIQSFTSLHHVLITSLKINRPEYEWIFNYLRSYIADINSRNFANGIALLADGRFICSVPDAPSYNKELKEVVKEYTDIVHADEEIIRKDRNFGNIKMEYDRVMKLYNKRIEEILEDPTRDLTPEEKYAITNQD